MKLKEDIKIFLSNKDIEKLQSGRTLAFEEIASGKSVILELKEAD